MHGLVTDRVVLRQVTKHVPEFTTMHVDTGNTNTMSGPSAWRPREPSGPRELPESGRLAAKPDDDRVSAVHAGWLPICLAMGL